MLKVLLQSELPFTGRQFLMNKINLSKVRVAANKTVRNLRRRIGLNFARVWRAIWVGGRDSAETFERAFDGMSLKDMRQRL